MVRQAPRSGSGKRREGVRCGAEGQHQRVPVMGTGKRREKRRGWGGGTGAENGEVGPETARNGAVNRVGVEYTKAARGWRLFECG